MPLFLTPAALGCLVAGEKKRSYLLILDAGSMKELARAEVPCAIRFGYHGNLVARDGSNTDLG